MRSGQTRESGEEGEGRGGGRERMGGER